MAHQHDDAGAEAVRDVDMDDMNDVAALLADLEDEELPEDEGQDDEPDTDDGDEGDTEGDEPEEPAIDAPASLTADEKERFQALPKEAQEMIAEVEARRNKDVQEGLSKARLAQQSAERKAAETTTQARIEALQEMQRFALSYAPQAPDPNLAYSDPQAYMQQQAIYQAENAQHQQLMQQIHAEYQQHQQQLQAAEQEALQADIRACADELPEMRDQQQWTQLVDRLTPIAKELGYDDERIAMALPSDILAMKRVADWKAKAVKYDELSRTKMAAVRSHKSAKPGVANSERNGKAKTQKAAFDRLRSTGDLRDAAAAIANL